MFIETFWFPFIDHAEFFHQVPDDILADMLPLAKKVALAIGLDESQYNLLQVNRNLCVQQRMINRIMIEQWSFGSSSKLL